jgi:hypothetical protein
VTVNKNTAVENGEGSLDKGATSYEFMQGYYDGFTWCDPAVIPEPQSRNTQSPNTQPPMQGGKMKAKKTKHYSSLIIKKVIISDRSNCTSF